MLSSLVICLWSMYLLSESHPIFTWSPWLALLLCCLSASCSQLLSTSWCSCPEAMSFSSLSLCLSWALVPPDHFSLNPFFLSKSFLYPAHSGFWCSCPTSFSCSSHPLWQEMDQHTYVYKLISIIILPWFFDYLHFFAAWNHVTVCVPIVQTQVDGFEGIWNADCARRYIHTNICMCFG